MGHWKSLRVCLNLNSVKTLFSKVICLIGKEDGRKKGRESLGNEGNVNEITD